MRNYDEARTGAVQRARQLRRNSTEAEKLLWDALRSAFPNHKWRRQMPVGPYFADLGCIAQKLIVELDGGQHMASADYDDIRTRFLHQRGYRLLRFWNHDVLGNVDGVLQRIAESLSPGRGREQRKLRKGEADRRPTTSPSHCSATGPSLSQGRGNEVRT